MSSPIRVIEPLGERAASLPLELGGTGAALALPGVERVVATIEASGRQWIARPAAEAQLRLNGIPLREEQPLAEGDVLGAGDAQLIVHPGAARIEVQHLAGNDTVAPLQQQVLPGDAIEAGVHEVFAAPAGPAAAAGRGGARSGRWVALGAVAALLAGFVAILFALVAVPLQLDPEGATVETPGLIDWQAGGRVFLLPGRRTLTVSHPGYRSQTLTLDVERALADATPLPVALEYLPGILEVDTGGVAAQLLVDGRVIGDVPGELSIEAGAHDLILRAPRHIDHVMEMTIEGGGARQQLAVTLQSSIGHLVLDTDPAGARIRIDGGEAGNAPQRLELEAGLHQLELVAPGRRAWKSEVAIIAGRTLDLGRIDLALPPAVVMRAAQDEPTVEEPSADAQVGASVAVASRAPRPPPAARLNSELLGTLVLLPAGKYEQGSARREQGRRNNEVQRTVTLTRAFYLAATEVSNAQFRAFRAEHASGIAQEKSLDLDPQAVSSVSWNDAVEFCNWLSLREGLPVAYERRDGRWQLVQPLNTGYRLPTEAEWEYAARYVDGRRWQRHAWGEVLPPPKGAANLAGEETLPEKSPAAALAVSLPGYADEHLVIAPVGSYAPTPAGLFDMGGNVSEWVHDVYASLPEAGEVTDPMGPAEDGPHAIRGANWKTTSIADLRLAWRDRGPAPSQVLGFRVARYAEELP